MADCSVNCEKCKQLVTEACTSEAVVPRCSAKKVFLEILRNSQ